MALSSHITLNTGAKMPALGLGTFLLRNGDLHTALDHALFLGYRLIDTAHSYNNEADIGLVLKDRISAGRLKRKDVFITTKINKFKMRKADAISCCQESLNNLQTKYVDALLIHHPWSLIDVGDSKVIQFDNVDIRETWSALQSLYKDGAAKSLGVSNFTVRQMERLQSCQGAPISHLQTECHAYLTQNRLKQFCDKEKIVFTAYSALGSPGRPEDQQEGQKSLMSDPCVIEISERMKRAPAQILINFLLMRGMVVLAKSSSPVRLKENFETLKWKLSPQDFDSILRLDKGMRYFSFSNRVGHIEHFSNEEF